MEHILLIIHVIIAAALIGVVLIQRSDTDGFGLGSGSGSNFMTGRATANLLTRTTAILAALFIANSLLLSVLAAHGGKGSIVDTITAEDQAAPIAVEKDEATGAVAQAINREATTQKPVTKMVKKSVKPAAKKPAAPAADVNEDAPAVPTAE